MLAPHWNHFSKKLVT